MIWPIESSSSSSRRLKHAAYGKRSSDATNYAGYKLYFLADIML